MPKFNKPDSPNIIWGVNALEGDLTKPDDSYIQTGWVQVKPPYEYENYSMNKLYQGFAYYNQLGIPEWDSVTEYQAGKSYVQGSNNRVYKCIQTNTNRNPATAGNGAYWERLRLTENEQIIDASFNTNGYYTMPGGLLIQWFEYDTGDISNNTNFNVTFPKQFPNQCFQVLFGDTAGSVQDSSGSTSEGMSITGFTTSSVSIHSSWFNFPERQQRIGSSVVRFFAIGI